MIQEFSAWRKNPRLVELGIGAGLFVLALAIRLPYLVEVPFYTDEGFEVLWGFDIALGKHFPLTAIDAYDGPFFSYVIAILFRLFGPSIWLPRFVIALAGAATVVAVYALARIMRGRGAGVLGAGFAMTSPVLVVWGSHHGWSSALTPFFTTLTAIALYFGVTRQRAAVFALSGLSAALALQAHPTSGAAMLGMFVWFLFQPHLRQPLTRRTHFLGLFFFILGYAPMIVANAQPSPPFLQVAYERSYAFVPTLDPAEYVRRLLVMLRVGGYFVGGGFGEPTLVLRVQAIALEIILIAAFVWAWRENLRLIPVTVLASLLLLPILIVGDSYRYYFYLFPLAYALLGMFGVAIWQTLAAKIGRPNLSRAAQSISLIPLVALSIYPLVTISNYYRSAVANEMTNQVYLRMLQSVRVQGICGAQLYVLELPPETIERKDFSASFGLANVNYVFTMEGCMHRQVTRVAFAEKLHASPSSWLILPPESVAYLDLFNLTLIETYHLPDSVPGWITLQLYRIAPKP